MAARRSLDKDLLEILEACAKRLKPDVLAAGVRVGVLVATFDFGVLVTLAERRRINKTAREVIAETARGDVLTLAVWVDKDAALKLLEIGESGYDRNLDVSELAGWTIVASILLNLDETITKE